MKPRVLRGDGLLRAHRALAALEEDPQQPERTRLLFGGSPSLYRSHQSDNSPRSQSTNPTGEEQRRREERKWQLIVERRKSRPYEQYEAQATEEQAWLQEAEENGIRPQPVHVNFYRLAHDIVRKRWEEQGIWSNKWNDVADGVWKHEQSLEPEPESDTDTAEARIPRSLFSILPPEPEPEPRRVKSDEEKHRMAERRAKLERDREASRPFHQFVYQLSTERERIQQESGAGSAVLPSPANINTIAYARVKAAWIKRKIWNNNWGTLPGMTWKHEDPLVVDDAADEPAPVEAGPPENSNYEAGALPRIIFGSPMPVGSGVTNASWQDSPADLVSSGLEDPDPERSPLFTDERPNQAQTHASDSTSLGPVHQSRAPKASTSEASQTSAAAWWYTSTPKSARATSQRYGLRRPAQWYDGQSAGGRLDETSGLTEDTAFTDHEAEGNKRQKENGANGGSGSARFAVPRPQDKDGVESCSDVPA